MISIRLAFGKRQTRLKHQPLQHIAEVLKGVIPVRFGLHPFPVPFIAGA
ncbi:hypothetical protein [Microvirga pudoricolor]|nr:hypothetical protein [Microvirga pudoricolor]MBM6595037.1 hypothetical protein [Microvirga pudoricolor]